MTRDGERFHTPAFTNCCLKPGGASAPCRDGTYSFTFSACSPVPSVFSAPCFRGFGRFWCSASGWCPPAWAPL
ncbi:DUF3761 domain-containing protein [Formicincola oecophyllae]|uniref:DUF3761 domain-containing protein n=1 Tax=Formicincola oecophyllae TaxID=2558361 RepID=A0A4Y6UD34_9PROT|nr:DUF3761 domain-containing protein [Formicincola oecophyllae]